MVAAILEAHTAPPVDPNTLPKDVGALRKIVLHLSEQLRHESSEKDKYRSLLRERIAMAAARTCG